MKIVKTEALTLTLELDPTDCLAIADAIAYVNKMDGSSQTSPRPP